MSVFRIQAPSRLHFGLLSWGDDAPRRYGGAGLLVDRPGLEIVSQPADAWSATGPMADRALAVAERVAGALAVELGRPVGPFRLEVVRAAPDHAGLGTGTQLSLAAARLAAAQAGRPDLTAPSLAELTGRGKRSGIGLHGFDRGGLIVDGGRRGETGVPPMLARLEFPDNWRALVLVPPVAKGLSGDDEASAFGRLRPPGDALIDRLCRLVLLGLMPAVVERDLAGFGAALTAIQGHVGRAFASVQGGGWVRPDLDLILDRIRAEGLVGVGQSSWGPTLYGFSDAPGPRREAIADRLRDDLAMTEDQVFWTRASRSGAVLEEIAG